MPLRYCFPGAIHVTLKLLELTNVTEKEDGGCDGAKEGIKQNIPNYHRYPLQIPKYMYVYDAYNKQCYVQTKHREPANLIAMSC